jgi:hypothetical protein
MASKARGVGQVHPVSIHQIGGVFHLAAEPDGISADRRPERSAGFLHVACEAEVAHAVGRLGQLAQEAARRLEGLVDVPERTGAAEARELEPGGRVALGDRAGLIDADEEEGDALRAGPLCKVDRRWATCSIEAPNMCASVSRSWRVSRAASRKRCRAGGPRPRSSLQGRSLRWRAPPRSGSARDPASPRAGCSRDQRHLVEKLEAPRRGRGAVRQDKPPRLAAS